MNAVLIRFIVNLFQLFQNGMTILTIFTRSAYERKILIKLNLNLCKISNKLTEVDDDVLVGFDYVIKELIGQFFDRVAVLLFNEPSQHLFLLTQITFVDAGNPVLKVNEGRQVIQTVLFSFLQVAYFDEWNIVAIAFIINIFQLFENCLMSLLVFII